MMRQETCLDEPLKLFPELLSEGTSRYVVLAKEIGIRDMEGRPGGQLVYRFPNGMAASIIRQLWELTPRAYGTYGAAAGLFEYAAGQYDSDDPDDWHLVRTPLTGEDVSIGWKTPEEVEQFLLAVKNLDPSEIEEDY